MAKTYFIGKISSVGYVANRDEHTLGYYERARNLLATNNIPGDVREFQPGNFKLAVAESYPELLELLNKEVKTLITNVKLRPEDFWMQVTFSETSDSLFWEPCACDCLHYRVSDLRTIKVN